MKFSITVMDFAAYHAKKKNCTREVARVANVHDAAWAAVSIAQDRNARGEFCVSVKLRDTRRASGADLGSLFTGAGHRMDAIGFVDRCDAALKTHLAKAAKWKRQCAFFYRYSQGLDDKYEKLPAGGYTSEQQRAFEAICWEARNNDAEFSAAIEREDYPAATARAKVLGFRTVEEIKAEGAAAA